MEWQKKEISSDKLASINRTGDAQDNVIYKLIDKDEHYIGSKEGRAIRIATLHGEVFGNEKEIEVKNIESFDRDKIVELLKKIEELGSIDGLFVNIDNKATKCFAIAMSISL